MMAIILRMSAFLLVALAIEYYWISRGMTSILNMIFTEYKQSGRLTWDNFKMIIILIVYHIIVILIFIGLHFIDQFNALIYLIRKHIKAPYPNR